MELNLPTFDYRQAYQIDINDINIILDEFINKPAQSSYYFRGMSKYDFICISTFYRHYISKNKNLRLKSVNIGFEKNIELLAINQDKYTNLSFDILEDFENNLRVAGINCSNKNNVIYLAQHYGLPTNLIDFTTDPKIALYFACNGSYDDDCILYMFDIFAHVKKDIEYATSYDGYKVANKDGDVMTKEEIIQSIIENGTTIKKDGKLNATPIVKIDDITFNKRISNQKGSFVYQSECIPFDSLMYRISPKLSFKGRKVFKIDKKLKPLILKILDEKHGINESFIYPDHEDDYLEDIKKAVDLTKEKFNI